MSTSPLPIILCGKVPAIARAAVSTLGPEYEVIHVTLSPATGVKDIPQILSGETPDVSNEPEQVGTKNYSRKPVAVVVGGGYDNAAFAVLHDAAVQFKGVPWLKVDRSIPTLPLGPEYGEAMARRIKEVLGRLGSEGVLGGDAVVGTEKEGEEGVVYY